jgi:hypothetical protein
MTCSWRAPTIEAQLAALERHLGRGLPALLRELYSSGGAHSRGLLPVSTGREYDESTAADPVARFLDARDRLDSVLGKAIGNAGSSQVSDDYVWPPSLLIIEDLGCAIYRAVDLDDPNLRVVEYEHFDPVDDPDAAASPARVAFREPIVPRMFQHRFTVVAESFDEWLGVGAEHARR